MRSSQFGMAHPWINRNEIVQDGSTAELNSSGIYIAIIMFYGDNRPCPGIIWALNPV